MPTNTFDIIYYIYNKNDRPTNLILSSEKVIRSASAKLNNSGTALLLFLSNWAYDRA